MPKQSSQSSKDTLKTEPFHGVVSVYKKPGETPLECLARLRQEQPQYKDAVLTYLGRLDPLASGVLLVAVNDENKNRQKYLKLPKEYEVEILCGVETDTHDVLGLLFAHQEIYQIPDEENLKKLLKTFIGKREVPYPMYSSKPYKGKPLFQHARDKSIFAEDNIKDFPKTSLDIQNIELLGMRQIEAGELEKQIYEMIEQVHGDFRQADILERWRQYFSTYPHVKHTIIKIRVECKSGSYMRTLAHEMRKEMGVSALAFSIKRIKIGEYSL